MMPTLDIYCGDAAHKLVNVGTESVQCCVTSPPYWGLRDYGVEGQLGQEKTPEEFVSNLVAVLAEVHRVLRDDGTLWLNLGDSYCQTDKWGGGKNGNTGKHTVDSAGGVPSWAVRKKKEAIPGLKPKDLVGIPWMAAFALRSFGWYLRSDIIWNKPNPMPESVTDRPTRAHEYIFLLSKSARYYYDAAAIREPASPALIKQVEEGYNGHAIKDYLAASVQDASATKSRIIGNARNRIDKQRGHGRRHAGFNDKWDALTPAEQALLGANKRSVWTIAPANYREAHFACVDTDTEALTPNGWKHHSDLSDGDSIAAFDKDRGVLVWQTATFHRYEADTELVVIEKRDSSQRLTLNHRCLVRRRSGAIAVVQAKDLVPGSQIPIVRPLVCSEFEGPGCTLAALLGWYLTEGEKILHGAIRINQSQSANPNHVATIRALLVSLDADFTERTRTRSWRGRPSVEVVFRVRGSIAERLHKLSADKSINLHWVGWTLSEITALLNAIIDGDGSRRADGRSCVIQKSKLFIDAVQILALRLGWRCVIGKHGDCYAAHFTSGDWLTLRGTNGTHKPLPRQKYHGIVWCPSVATTFWLARRSGKTFITGNTFPADLIRPCVMAGTKPGDTVLDPFAGSGTTGQVALELGRNAILIELNPANVELCRKRCAITPGLQLA